MRTSRNGEASSCCWVNRLIFNNLQPIGVGVVAVVGSGLPDLATSINAHT